MPLNASLQILFFRRDCQRYVDKIVLRDGLLVAFKARDLLLLGPHNVAVESQHFFVDFKFFLFDGRVLFYIFILFQFFILFHFFFMLLFFLFLCFGLILELDLVFLWWLLLLQDVQLLFLDLVQKDSHAFAGVLLLERVKIGREGLPQGLGHQRGS